MSRPFYTRFAWVYDRLINAPFAERADFIASELAEFGINPPASILDAGCGTGGYAAQLAARGFNVHGIDRSKEQIIEAHKKIGQNQERIKFEVGDILKLPEGDGYQCVFCRGVLNDLVDEESRRAVFKSFAFSLDQGGLLIFDVRHWERSALAKEKTPVVEHSLTTERGYLSFRSECQLDRSNKCLLIRETHRLISGQNEETTEHDLVMKCWTEEEVEKRLSNAGFRIKSVYGNYDRLSLPENTEKMIVIAQLSV